MERINIKPLSVNEAYYGRRKSTKELRAFKKFVLLSLKPQEIPEGKLYVSIEFGFSSKASDIDNAVKAFLDCLQAKYGFNDNRVYEMHLTKFIVDKGEEYIKFKIKQL